MAVADGRERKAKSVRSVRTRWSGTVLTCGKCLRRHADGKGLRQALKAEIKRRTDDQGSRRKVKLIKIACVGLCPRHAVVTASAATLSLDEVVLVQDADGALEAVTRLLPGRRSPP